MFFGEPANALGDAEPGEVFALELVVTALLVAIQYETESTFSRTFFELWALRMSICPRVRSPMMLSSVSFR